MSGEISWGEFQQYMERDQIAKLEVDGSEIKGEFKDKVKREGRKNFVVYGPRKMSDDLQAHLSTKAKTDKNFQVKFKPEEKDTFVQSLIISWLPMLVLFVIFFIF